MLLDSINYIKYTLTSLFGMFPMKVLMSVLLIVTDFLFGIEHNAALSSLLFLIFVDTFTGVTGAKLAGEKITSRRFFTVVLKIVVYYLLIAAAFNTEKAIPGVMFIDDAVLAFIALTELISILENVAKMGFIIPNKLLNRLQELRDN
jgi:phage-related holin